MNLSNYLPDLTPAYNALLSFLKGHQGEKGYFRTDDDGGDTIWGFEFSEAVCSGIEKRVVGVRATEDNEIEVFLEEKARSYDVEFTDEDFKNDDNWSNLRFSDVYYRETLYNIIEFIDEYVENN